ncbi:RusA family crossover junction endodeoxyribonuclease [Chloroflexota bacterium]
MKRYDIMRTGTNPPLELEDAFCSIYVLMAVKTGDKFKRYQVIEQIRNGLALWMKNSTLDPIRNKGLDLTIVFNRESRYVGIQDVDNMAKLVMDALKKEKGDSRFLFHDDKQVIRLLVYKQVAKKLSGYDTDSISISCRVHNPNKQMILENQKDKVM